MIKVSIEVGYKTARFTVGVQAQSIQQALSIVATRYPKSVVRVSSPIGGLLRRSFCRLSGTDCEAFA